MSKTTLFDSRIKKYAYREAAQLYGELGSSPAGLSPEQVEKQREKYGSNRFGSRRSDTMLRRLRRAFINPFNVILFVLGCISLVTDGFLASDFSKNATTALIIFSMILISGGIRLVQELRAKNAARHRYGRTAGSVSVDDEDIGGQVIGVVPDAVHQQPGAGTDPAQSHCAAIGLSGRTDVQP